MRDTDNPAPTALARGISRRRLHAQRLSTTAFAQPAEVVSWFGAMQAQDYLGALWAVGLRLADGREQKVERALAERSIVRSWPMRGTLHFLAAADARWIIELLAPRAARAAAPRLRRMGIDEQVLSRARRALVKEMEGVRPLTRPAAYQALEHARIATGGQRGLHILWQLAHEGLLCFGPRHGKQQTFVLLEEWLPDARRLPRDVALPEIAQRYFRAHGPATVRDFAWWSGMALAEARAAVNMAATGLEKEILGAEDYWSAPAVGPVRVAPVSGRAWVLPPFDELFVGYADRTASIDPVHVGRVGAFEILGPSVVLGGRWAGTWKRRLTGNKVTCSISSLGLLNDTGKAAVRSALARYARFLGRDLET
jgi:hypothetical protein